MKPLLAPHQETVSQHSTDAVPVGTAMTHEAALISPHWPLRLTAAVPLNLLLVLAALVPVLSGDPGDVLSLILVVPAIALTVVARMTFHGLTASVPAGALRGRVLVAAGVTGAGVAGLAWISMVVAGAGATPIAVGLGGAAVAGALALGSMLRSVELARWAQSRRVFFIGSTEQSSELGREIRRRGDLSLVGFTATDVSPRDAESRDSLVAGIQVVRPTTLVLSAEASRDEYLVGVASDVHVRGLRVRALNDFYEQHFAKVALSELSQAWFLFDVAEIHRPRVYGKVKRLLEGAVAGALLLLLSPALLVIALLIKLSDGGPLLFRQVRVGKDGRAFTLVKFRTMTLLDKDGPAEWAGQHVARITPVGRKLRRFRFDELPQLWSVVRGDLALVGPRPEQPAIVEHLSESIDLYGARHKIRPGITGWAQVNHGYGGSVAGTLEKLQYDFFYIKRQSLRLDILILIATVRTILYGQGA